MIQFILISLAVTALFGPGVIYGMYGDKMPVDLKMIFFTVWLLMVTTVFGAANIIFN